MKYTTGEIEEWSGNVMQQLMTVLFVQSSLKKQILSTKLLNESPVSQSFFR